MPTHRTAVASRPRRGERVKADRKEAEHDVRSVQTDEAAQRQAGGQRLIPGADSKQRNQAPQDTGELQDGSGLEDGEVGARDRVNQVNGDKAQRAVLDLCGKPLNRDPFDIEGFREVELVRRVNEYPRVVGELHDHAGEQQARPDPGCAPGRKRRPQEPVHQCQHLIDIQAPAMEAVGGGHHLTVAGQPEILVLGGRVQPSVHEYQKGLRLSKRRFRRQPVSSLDVVVDKRESVSEFFFLVPSPQDHRDRLPLHALNRQALVGDRPMPSAFKVGLATGEPPFGVVEHVR